MDSEENQPKQATSDRVFGREQRVIARGSAISPDQPVPQTDATTQDHPAVAQEPFSDHDAPSSGPPIQPAAIQASAQPADIPTSAGGALPYKEPPADFMAHGGSDHLPIGVYLLAALIVVNNLIALYVRTNWLAEIASAGGIILGVGLCFRRGGFRKAAVVLFLVFMVIDIAAIVTLYWTNARFHTLGSQAIQALDSAETANPIQPQAVAAEEAKIRAEVKLDNQIAVKGEISNGVEILLYLVFIAYLRGDKVKRSFS